MTTANISDKHRKRILPVIVLSQFAGTSVWFVGNALLPELQQRLQLSTYAISLVTTAVMLGFVGGTLLFSLFSVADRYSPVRIFFLSTVVAAAANVSIIWLAHGTYSLFTLRFIVGFFLAGIYPVGMKIAADWFEKGLGKALGFLVGALVLGTALPHLLKDRHFDLPWRTVLYTTSAFCLAGGLLMWRYVGDGPYRSKGARFRWDALPAIFRSRPWRAAAFGYFGHMWELYTYWGFVPVILALYARNRETTINIPLFSFLAIATGAVGCMVGGKIAHRVGSAKVAVTCIAVSGVCCFLSPFIFHATPAIFFSVIFLWSICVSGDSPQFSTLVSQYAEPSLRGTALTIYNSIGFLVTTISLIVIDRVFHSGSWFAGEHAFLLLGLGPLWGIWAMRRHGTNN